MHILMPVLMKTLMEGTEEVNILGMKNSTPRVMAMVVTMITKKLNLTIIIHITIPVDMMINTRLHIIMTPKGTPRKWFTKSMW